MSRLNQQIQLRDGRRLGFDERGPSNGKPLFYFHGSPSSRRESTLYIREELLWALNVRLIAVDRPGMGLSDFQPNRRLLDWSQDVLALADHLRVNRFAILAYSLGGPYGAVCAYAIPERLTKVGIVSGAAMFTEPELMQDINAGTRRFLNLPRENPFASRLFLGTMLGVMPRIAPGMFTRNAASMLPKSDRTLVSTNPVFQKGFICMLREAMQQGVSGAYHESLLTITDWGFRLQDIQIPVLLWHGEVDQNIPVGMARYMRSAIPKCEAKFYPNEGHLSLFKKNADEIVRTVVD